MIIDTSALAAILKKEEGGSRFDEEISRSKDPRISAATYLELAIVVDRRGDAVVSRQLDDFLGRAAIVIEPVTERQARIAREAYRDYGKGSGHPAGLNFGDCFAYALARDMDEPLLFKGNDFSRTDIKSALSGGE